MQRLSIVPLIIGIFLALPPASEAETSTALLQVVARVVTRTTVFATSLDFGSFTRETENVKGQASITVTASPCTVYHVALNAGLHYSDAWRNLEKAGFLARYRIFQPSGREWGDKDFEGTYPRGRSVAGMGNGSPTTYTVNGELYPQSMPSDSPPGTYSDVVTVTVYY